MHTLIPQPHSVEPAAGAFVLTAETSITVSPAAPEVAAIADYLAARLRPATGFALPVRPAEAA
ncbi:MAG: glycoside hydrolase family 20 zincin-like fold domain-containing protein, partial [Candidatus Promineofilum sp.]|nr:glycoside hydrolase family 20 zincin-like fold domain-containing protein [Promineifilum sp.]